MSSKRCSHPFSLVCLAMVTLFLAQSTEAKYRGVNNFCKTSDYRLLCTSMVHGALNWHDAVANAIGTTLDLAKRLQPKLQDLEPALADVPSITKDSLTRTCKENYERAVYSLERALGFLEQKDIGGLNTFLSGAGTSDCSDAFNQFNVALPDSVTRITSLLDREISNCLAITQQS